MTNERTITLDHPEKKAFSDLEAISHETESNGSQVKDHVEEQLPTTDHGHDGGYGWLVVLGAFLVQVTSFGTITSWGVMQDYYEQHFFDQVPNAALNLSFVGTIAMVFLNSVSPIAQILVSMYGIRTVMIIGTLCIALGLEMAGFATQIWHLYLTQGIVFGTGAACIYVSIMGVAPQWFSRRRGLALGIIASGSGIGGLAIPFIMTSVNQSLGPAWSYRILGFICLVCDVVACLTIRERTPSTGGPRKRLSQMIDLSVMKNARFVLFMVASNIGLFGYFIPYFFLPSYATFIGLSETEGSALVAVSAAGNFVGRILCGLFADRIGKVNTNLIFTFISSLSCLLIWTFAGSYGSLMAFSVVFGMTSGSFFALISPLTAYLLGMQQFPSGLSLLLLSNVIAVFGPNIASAIESGVSSAPFFSYKMFAGVAYLIGAILLLILKLNIDRNLFAKV